MKTEIDKNIFARIVILAIVLTAIGIRCLRLKDGLPYYSIDENDVIEAALSYTAGDINPYWYKYGPLFAYILAIIYSTLQGIGLMFASWDQFFFSAFYNAGSFYLIARIIHGLITLAICAIIFCFVNRHYNKQTAWIALIISSAPVLETLTEFTIRVDTLQGLWALLALLFAANFNNSEQTIKNHILSAFFLALSVATKPIPGLLVIPAIIYAHATTHSTQHVRLFSIFSLAALATHFAVHPYSLINFDTYILEQISVFTHKSQQGGIIPGWNFNWLPSRLGWPFAIGLCVTLVTSIHWKDRPSRILFIYIATFCCAYIPFDVREYWYAAVVPAFLILLSRLIYITIQKYAPLSTACSLTIIVSCIIIFPVFDNVITTPAQEMLAAQNAEIWIENNIPSGAPILAIGWYPITLPRLTNTDPSQQAQWGEYFMYGRNHNHAWFNEFKKAHKNYKNSKRPFYNIINIRKHYGNYKEYDKLMILGLSLNNFNNYDIDKFSRLKNRHFVITASPQKYCGEWETNKGVKCIARFQDLTNEIKIFYIQRLQKVTTNKIY
jgi:hypothetical protein